MSGKILNNSKEMKRIDKSGMLSFCVETRKYCEEAVNWAEAISINYSAPKTIVVAGMGGSAIGGELLRDWSTGKIGVPIEVCRGYSLPNYVDENTLVFVVSYSGETEETLSMFLDAIKKDCMIFCISSDGKLSNFAEKLGFPLLSIPSGIPPRAALPYLFLPQLIILDKIGLISDVDSEINESLKVLEKVVEENRPEISLNENFSKKLASQINQTVPVIYGFTPYRSVAKRCKQQFNENSKIPARWDFFPELCHNEIEGWEAAKELAKCFSVIFIRDEGETSRIKKRINFTKELVLDRTEQVFEIWSKGESRLAKMLYTVCIADFTSIYLAILRGVDPTPVKSINLLKKRVSHLGVKDHVVSELQKILEG